MNVDEFLQTLKEKPIQHKGKLTHWKDDILKIRSHGGTYADIVKYLEINNVSVTISAVQKFCAKYSDTDNLRKSKPALATPQTSSESAKNLSELSIKSSKASALPSWHMGKAKSLDDLI